MCRQRAGCNPGTANADGQRAWWQLPRGIWRVLSVWRLANGRLECPNNREGYVQAKGRLQTLEQQTLTARGLGGQLPRGIWRVLRVLSVWSLANGRLECPNNRGLCAALCGRLQCWNSQGWRPEGLVAAAARDLESFQGFKRLKPGKRQAWMP